MHLPSALVFPEKRNLCQNLIFPLERQVLGESLVYSEETRQFLDLSCQGLLTNLIQCCVSKRAESKSFRKAVDIADPLFLLPEPCLLTAFVKKFFLGVQCPQCCIFWDRNLLQRELLFGRFLLSVSLYSTINPIQQPTHSVLL